MPPPNINIQTTILPPTNLSALRKQIQGALGNINATINIDLSKTATRGLDALNKRLESLRSNLDAVGRSSAVAQHNVNNMGSHFNNVAASINRTKDASRSFNRNMESISGNTRRAQTALEGFASQIEISGKRFAAFAVASRTFIAFYSAMEKGVSEAVKYQRELVRLQQVGGDSKSAIAGVSAEVRKLSTNLGVSSSELIKAAVTLRQAEFSIKDVKKTLDALAKTELAPNFDNMQDTVEGLIALNSQFKGSTEDNIKILSQFNKVASQTAVESGDLITAVQKVGATFKAAGGSVEELTGIFTAIRSTTRESADTIATGLRTIIARTSRLQAADDLQKLGINIRKTAEDVKKFGGQIGDILPVYERFKVISEGLKNVNDSSPKFSQAVEIIGGIRQFSKTIPLIKEFERAEKARQIAVKSGSSLDENAIQAQESLEIQLTRLTEKLNKLFETFGKSAAIKEFVKLMVSGADAALELANKLEPLAPILLSLATVASIRLGAGIFNNFKNGIPVNVRSSPGGGTGFSFNKFAEGGIVPGPKSINRDIVPALLSPGEFILKKSAVQALGIGQVQHMNKGGKPFFSRLGNPMEFFASMLNPGRFPKRSFIWGKENIPQRSENYFNPPIKLTDTQKVGGGINFARAGSRALFTPIPSKLPSYANPEAEFSAMLNPGSFPRTKFIFEKQPNIYRNPIVPIPARGLGFGDIDRTLNTGRGRKFFGRKRSTGFRPQYMLPYDEPGITLLDLLGDAAGPVLGSAIGVGSAAYYQSFGSVAEDPLINLAGGAIGAAGGAMLSELFRGRAPGLSNGIIDIMKTVGSDAKGIPGGIKKFFRQFIDPPVYGPGRNVGLDVYGKPINRERLKRFKGRSGRNYRFASGGLSHGSIPALLTPGELRIPAHMAQQIGYGQLNRINNGGASLSKSARIQDLLQRIKSTISPIDRYPLKRVYIGLGGDPALIRGYATGGEVLKNLGLKLSDKQIEEIIKLYGSTNGRPGFGLPRDVRGRYNRRQQLNPRISDKLQQVLQLYQVFGTAAPASFGDIFGDPRFANIGITNPQSYLGAAGIPKFLSASGKPLTGAVLKRRMAQPIGYSNVGHAAQIASSLASTSNFISNIGSASPLDIIRQLRRGTIANAPITVGNLPFTHPAFQQLGINNPTQLGQFGQAKGLFGNTNGVRNAAPSNFGSMNLGANSVLMQALLANVGRTYRQVASAGGQGLSNVPFRPRSYTPNPRAARTVQGMAAQIYSGNNFTSRNNPDIEFQRLIANVFGDNKLKYDRRGNLRDAPFIQPQATGSFPLVSPGVTPIGMNGPKPKPQFDYAANYQARYNKYITDRGGQLVSRTDKNGNVVRGYAGVGADIKKSAADYARAGATNAYVISNSSDIQERQKMRTVISALTKHYQEELRISRPNLSDKQRLYAAEKKALDVYQKRGQLASIQPAGPKTYQSYINGKKQPYPIQAFSEAEARAATGNIPGMTFRTTDKRMNADKVDISQVIGGGGGKSRLLARAGALNSRLSSSRIGGAIMNPLTGIALTMLGDNLAPTDFSSNKGRNMAGVAGALSGAGTGLVLGGLTGGPLGAALGGLAGAAIGAASSIKDFDKKVSQAKFDKSLTEYAQKINFIAGRNQGLNATDAMTVKKAINSIYQQSFRESGDNIAGRQAFFAENASKLPINGLINQIITNSKGKIKNVDDFTRSAGGVGNTLLNAYALSGNISIKEAKNQIGEIIKNASKFNSNQENINKFEAALTDSTLLFESLNKAIEEADLIYNQNNANLSKFSSLIGGSFNASSPLRGTFSQSTAIVGSSLGDRGATVTGIASDYNKAIKALPAIIRSSAQSASMEDTFAKSIDELLGKNSVVGERFKKGFGTISDDILKKGTDDIEKTLLELAKISLPGLTEVMDRAKDSIASKLDDLAQGYAQVRSFTPKIRANQIESVSTGISRLKNRAAAFGLDPSQVLNQRTLNSAAIARQGLLTGRTVASGSFNANTLGNDLKAVQDQIRSLTDLRSQQTDVRDIKNTNDQIIALGYKAEDLQDALENLASSSDLLSTAQEKLSAIENEKDARIGFAEKYLRGNATDRATMAITAQQAQLATFTGLDAFDPKVINDILDFFKSAGNITFSNGLKGDQIANNLISNSMAGQQIGLGGLNQQAGNLRGEIDAILANSQAANKALEESLMRDKTDFYVQLNKNFDQFLSDLGNQITSSLKDNFDRMLSKEGESVNNSKNLLADLTKMGFNPRSIPGLANLNSSGELDKLRNQRNDINESNQSLNDLGKYFLEAFAKNPKLQTGYQGRDMDISRLIEQGFRETGVKYNPDQFQKEIGGGSIKNILSTIEDIRNKTIKTTEYNTEIGQALGNNNIAPEDFKKALSTNDPAQLAKLKEALDAVAAAGGSMEALANQITQSEIAIAQKRTQGFASGGMVSGFGTGDNVHAKLTPGEFVVNRSAASRNMGALRYMNAGGMIDTYTGYSPLGNSGYGDLSKKNQLRMEFAAITRQRLNKRRERRNEHHGRSAEAYSNFAQSMFGSNTYDQFQTQPYITASQFLYGNTGPQTASSYFDNLRNQYYGMYGYFARGGSVFKPKGSDTVPAMLTPGEFVVNPSAAKRFAPLLQQMNTQYKADGGTITGGSGGFGDNLIKPLNDFSSSASLLYKTFSDLNTRIGELASSLSNITLTIEGKQTVEVVVNGAQTLTAIIPEVRNIVNESIREALNARFTNDKFTGNPT